MARKSNKRVETVFGKEIIVNEQYYLNNRSLPTVDSQYEWTPEMIAALDKAREDIHYFAETFFTIINGNRQRECIKLREYQSRTLKSMQDHNRLLLLFGRQSGKCVSLNTKVVCRFKYLPIPIKIKVGTLYKIQKSINFIKNKLKTYFPFLSSK